MNRTPEQWAQVKPEAVLAGSEAQARNVLEMALQDIGTLARMVPVGARDVTALRAGVETVEQAKRDLAGIIADAPNELARLEADNRAALVIVEGEPCKTPVPVAYRLVKEGRAPQITRSEAEAQACVRNGWEVAPLYMHPAPGPDQPLAVDQCGECGELSAHSYTVDLRDLDRPSMPPPNFRDVFALMPWHTANVSEFWRTMGVTVPRKAEDEQAFGLWWLLRMAMAHGANWRTVAGDTMNAAKAENDLGKGDD